MAVSSSDVEARHPPQPRGKAGDPHWRTAGYKKYSRFLSHSRHFFFLRQFRRSNVRVLLAMQDEIVQLEVRLDSIDETLSQPSNVKHHNGTFRDIVKSSPAEDRHDLIKQLSDKLKKYNEYLYFYQHTADDAGDRPMVELFDITSVKNWHDSHGGAIKEDETAYLDQTEDLVYVLPVHQRPILHEYFCGIFANTFFKREVEGATATTDRDTPEDPDLFLTRKDKADRLLTKILFPLGMGMLVGPLWILNEVQEPRARLGVITGFVVLFSTFVFLSTLVKTWELLAAAAAYSAVLMVFMSQNPTTTTP